MRSLVLAGGLVAACAAQVRASSQDALVTIRVRSDDGYAATGIVVGVSTFTRNIPGEGFGRDEHEKITAQTDSNGMVTVSIKSMTGELWYGPQVPLPRFYWSRGSQIRFSDVVDGKWQPWNPTVDLELKRIGNPTALFARRFGEGKPRKMPEFSKPIGFDLMKGDWVSPHGKGETADFIFTLDSRVSGDKDFDATLGIAFSTAGDGIQPVYAMPFTGSQLRLPRSAPADGYESNVVRRTSCRPGENIHRESREDQNYFFRVRTRMNDAGEIASALYGKIHGEIGWWQNGVIRFTYYLNPTPNDRNLEFDPARNLFTGLSSLEDVRDP